MSTQSPAQPDPSVLTYTVTIGPREPMGTRAPMIAAMAKRLDALRQAADGWIDRESTVAAKRREVLAQLPYQPQPVPFAPVLLREERFSNYTRQVFRLQINPDDTTEAVLYLPTHASPQQRVPALLGLHEHGGQLLLGWEKMCDLPDMAPAFREYQQRCYGGRLPNDFFASQGFAVLSIDQIGFGSRALWRDEQEYLGRHQLTPQQELDLRLRMRYEHFGLHRALMTFGFSEAQIAIYDSMRAIDFLASHPAIDPQRIGAFGLSVGSMHCHYVAALDPRVKASVRVCWAGDLSQMVQADGPRVLGVHFLLPHLNRDLHVPQWIALSHPNAALIINGTQDSMYSLSNQQQTREAVLDIARRQGRQDRLRWSFFDGPHCFYPPQQDEALAFFREFLG